MPRFRSAADDLTEATALTAATVRALLAEAVLPGHFFLDDSLTLDWTAPVTESIPWEIFKGRLLDGAFTRQRRTFEAWNVFLVEDGARSAEPLLSLKLDAAAGVIHVTRAIWCYAWEGYDSGGNVYLSRETRKWVRELVGTIHLDQLGGTADLRDELVCRLFQAVVGTSRLPLTSVEAPLPSFSLGKLAYFHRPDLPADSPPLRRWDELARLPETVALAPIEQAKLLETLLHVTPPPELAGMARLHFGDGAGSAIELLLAVFNEVSLSPYTDLTDKVLGLLRTLQETGRVTPAGATDFLGRLLRLIVRHLSAYDLVTFHHRGANYPDALLLDALLKAYLDLAEVRPELFAETALTPDAERRARRLRRRALRQAWLLRTWYEGLPVPEAPTSQGEALRVLTGSYPRVPEEQILQPARRTRHLYEGDPLTQRGSDLLRQSLRDLDEPEELRELGMALFLDRPLGDGKAPAEPDATPLLSYEAFSPSLVERRLQHLAGKLGLLPATELERLRQPFLVKGLPLDHVAGTSRPGVVSLADARQAAPDFVVLRTTKRSARQFLELFDLEALLGELGGHLLIISGARAGVVVVHDAGLEPRVELAYDPAAGYVSRAGIDLPRSGLRMVRRVQN